MLKKLHEDLALYAPIEQDAEMGENGTIKMLTNQNHALARENRHADAETSDSAIKKLETEISQMQNYIDFYENRLASKRSLTSHLEQEIHELQDTITALQDRSGRKIAK